MARDDHAVLDRHAFFHAEPLHQPGDAIRAEDAHQVVFERQEEARRARVALAAGAAAQLVVDAPRFVPLGADDVQAAEVDDFLVLFLGLALEVREDAIPVRALARDRTPSTWKKLTYSSSSTYFSSPLATFSATPSFSALLPRHVFGVAAEQDVGAAAGHVGGDRDGALAAGLRDDFRFLRVILRVEHDVLDALALQHVRDALGLLDRHRADQHRAALLGWS